MLVVLIRISPSELSPRELVEGSLARRKYGFTASPIEDGTRRLCFIGLCPVVRVQLGEGFRVWWYFGGS